jgi:2-amino-4-hydroxy-6-hydroxymethyldihydropteridine diphosphokinase
MMKNGNTVYIGLGSNLENPMAQIFKALKALNALPTTDLLKYSSLYHSKPLGPSNQPDYINAVAVLMTELPPLTLLHEMQTIENKQGRVRTGQQWGPRTLDLDMLLYNDKLSQEPQLILPHPGLYERAFVLHPLYEVVPDLVLPNGQPLSHLVQQFSAHELRIVNDE